MILKHSAAYLFILILLSFSSAWAQNCKEVSDWMDIIKNEYPELKTDSYLSKNIIDNLALNLYSDKYFVPFRGKSFSSLSEKARSKDWRKIQSCYIKNGYQTNSHRAWVFNNIIYNYQLDFRTDTFGKKIDARNQLRDALSQELRLLSDGKFDYNSIQKLKSELNSEYAVLFPSEIEIASNTVNKYESLAADRMLSQKAKEAQDLVNSKSSLETLLNFKASNSTLYLTASESMKTQVNSKVESKVVEVVDYLMPKEEMKLLAAKSTDANVRIINRLIADFKKDYDRVLHMESAKKTFELFQERKTEIVSNMISYLTDGIESIKSQDELDQLATLLLSDLDENSTTYLDLSGKIKNKRISIINKQNRIAQEKRSKAAEKQILFTEQANIRANEVAKLQNEVKVLRQKLNITYANSLPSYEDLHYVLQAYLVMINPSKKYSDSEASNFINKTGEMGFERLGSGKMSNKMIFKNSFGHYMHFNGNFEKSSGSVSLRISDASEEIKSFYDKDIRANYRNRLEAFKTPNTNEAKSNYFVNSGRTLYKYYTAGNSLTVEAKSNYATEVPIEAELIGATIYKIIPFSTFTNLFLNKGQSYTLKASGKMKVGNFLGNSGPEGINASKIYNIDKRFPHGSLIGKIGEDGDWFLVGKGGTFTTNSKGRLYLRVNDRLVTDNDGYYTIQYEIK
ncbi:hypothetical protein SAMN05192553_105110 [Cyclobacterium xiamenense]|uniref:Uncharacterized protein n=2 Tax=Cyclobacterium xiamenense TaxID=1297121 RepID=A0A1H7A5Q5_9BACT|nr:hypothetical protein SAMN05192553_105110 [Cyclobacterium xiamenense]